MGVSGFHLLLLGTLVSVGGALLLAKRHWRRPASSVGPLPPGLPGNPFTIRHDIIRHSETMAGVRWLTIGGLALLFGLARKGEVAYFIGFWTDILLHVAVLSGVWVATVARTKEASRRLYMPKMIELHQQELELHLGYLRTGGYGRFEIEQGLTLPESTRLRRLAEVTSFLDQLGALIDVPRRSGELDHRYAERLRPVFESRARG